MPDEQSEDQVTTPPVEPARESDTHEPGDPEHIGTESVMGAPSPDLRPLFAVDPREPGDPGPIRTEERQKAFPEPDDV